MSSPAPFGDRLAAAIGSFGPLCVGIDPHAHLLEDWGLSDSSAGAEQFGLRVVEACAGEIAVIKPQVAFYERFGSAGFAALESVIGTARAAGILVIADAKRGDLGSTMAAYASAWIEQGSALESDAMTVSPYLGFGSLEGTLDTAKANGKGVFVLSATSNPEAAELQTSVRDGRTVAGAIAGLAAARNAADYPTSPLGSVGVVLGATVDFDALGVDLDVLAASPATPVLAPGFGHQGARFDEVRRLFAAATPGTLMSASRSILAAGPDGIVEAIRAQKRQVLEAVA
ncbi:orotidine-5'-phosphate decarboxylase [Amnibacterium flavum]|uniref:Orotidine-5'-phosphate decarboxylase n=1 Tax=Amnibacterium flavum TaxID=2173173 RepID=A0A2V1HP86_9MICO|nr:orotidine-5'-phosphate decarboxylase [Amnibacterium flavum]PVZ94368.1 orotidine-5'-phosphate decarboxylase [Amnibacterium flavum]